MRGLGRPDTTTGRSPSLEVEIQPMLLCRASTGWLPSSTGGGWEFIRALSVAQHLDYYLDEFTFRFNRRSSRARGLLFYRLVQQALQVDPAPYKQLVKGKERD